MFYAQSNIYSVSVSQTFAEAEYLHTFDRQVLCCFVHFLTARLTDIPLSHSASLA